MVVGVPLFAVADFTPEVREAFVVAGLWDADRKCGLHMLRRTFASRLLGSGVDIETVRELGGWADLTTVQRYVASTDDRKRAAVEKL
jgi:site-specific recombinase XerD